MSSMFVPSVNGISPREGTPGTKLTIRGENLGTSSSDILHIWMNKYDVSCTVQWHSTKKLNIISSFGEGVIKIIVETKSGGRGTCDVDYYQSISQNVGLQDQVSYWPPNEQKQYQVLSSYSKRTQPKQIASEMMEDIKDVMFCSQTTPVGFAMSDDELYKIYKGRGSTSFTEPDFNPILYLLKYHRTSKFQDLVNLLEHYKTALANERLKEPISIVKANLYTIFQCLDCLEVLKKKIDESRTISRPMSGAFAENDLRRTLEDSKNIAHHMYEEVLKRRDYADCARSALSVMQRFRFLFNLPRLIRENIGKGEYSLVINDYLRARSLFGNSEIRLFQQVYKDVVEVIDKFKGMLKQQLLEMPNKCDAVKITIRLMRQLEVDYDPTLLCLNSQKEWILQAISKLSTSSFTGSSSYKTRLDKSSTNSRSKHPVVLMVEELNKLLSERFTETLSLASYYLEPESTAGTKSGVEVVSEPIEERTARVEEMVMSVVTAYSGKVKESLVLGALQPGWLVYCVQQVRQAIEALPMDDLPRSGITVLVTLLEELRVRAVRSLLARAEQDIVGLSFKETWVAEISDTLGATTRLPGLYRSLMTTAITEVQRAADARHALERPLCSQAGEEAAFSGWVVAAMCAYVRCVEAILEKLRASTVVKDNEGEAGSPDGGPPNINVSRRLLLMANNCHQCSSMTVPSIVEHLRQQGLPGADAVLREVTPHFSGLHGRLVSQYVDLRLQGLIGPIEAGMTVAGYDYREVPPARGARSFVHSVLTGLAQAHCELELVSPHLSRDCLVELGVRAVEEVARVVETVARDRWSRRGHVQLAADLGALETAVLALAPERGSARVRQLWREAASLINVMRGAYRLSSDEQAAIRTVAAEDARTMSMLLAGFQETR